MQIPWISSSLRDTAFVGHPIKNNTGFLAPQSCLRWWLEWLHLVDSVKEKWRRVRVIWCLVWDRGSLGPLCALTDHITISENYSVSKRSHGPAKDGLRVKLGIQWWEAVFRGDLRWWDMKGLSCPVLFFNSQNLESFLKNYIFLLKFSKEFLLTRLVWPHACRAVNCHICNRWLWLMSYPNSYVNICFLHHIQPLQLKLMIYNIIFWHLPAKIPFSIHIHVSKCWRLLLSKHYHQSLVRDSTSVSVYHLDIWTLPDVNFRAREQI